MVTFTRTKLLGESNVDPKNLTDPQKLACLAMRLGLDFQATEWSNRGPERTQLERHMRLCLVGTPGFRTMVTISPSEPLLADAAAVDMGKWSVAEALLKHLKGSYLCKGDRGELIASLLLLLARDNALKVPRPLRGLTHGSDGRQRVVSVVNFLTSLLNCDPKLVNKHLPHCFDTSGQKTKTLGAAFKDASIWFNHFVKVHDYGVINEKFLWHFIVRGAAVVCANGHIGVDVFLPILFNNRLLQQNVSAMMVQIKNALHYDSPQQSLFDNMDPFAVGLFSDKEKKHPPVIRMVLSMASKESCVIFPDPPSITSARRNGNARFTCYDIWCAGTTDTTFKVISSAENHIYAELLLRSQTDLHPYGDPNNVDEAERVTARRKMHSVAREEDIHHVFLKNIIDKGKRRAL